MHQRRTTLVMIVFLVLLPLALTVGVVAAQAPSTPGSTLPYSGRLTDPGGQPVTDGLYDFVFTLYASEKDDHALWSETQSGVNVTAGNLNVVLGQNVPLSKNVASRSELWLAVSVRGPHDADFTLLNPRRNLNAPSAVNALTCPHSHFTDSWYGSIYSGGGLAVSNSGGGDGIDAYSYSTRTLYAGVYAYNLAGSGDGTGVYGGSYYGSGVQAYSAHNDGLEATSDTDWASAIYAHATNGNGVWAVSTNKVGVYATTANTTTNVAALAAYNSGTPTGGYGGNITSNNYRGAFIGTLHTASWYGALIDGGLLVTNGSCTGCTLVYVGQNKGNDAVLPGDLVAIAGVATNAATGQPVMLVHLAQSASDPVIGVVVGGASAPGSQTGPDKIQSSKIAPGEYLQIAVSGLVQARVADKSIAIGDHLSPGASGAIIAADAGDGVARVMSKPDENGLVWVMVDAR